MNSLNKSVQQYTNLLKQGDIREAYKGLIEYMMHLRIYLQGRHPDFNVSGSIYQGYMDMTYFSFTPAPLISKRLKVALVYIHEKARFEVWLSGYNKTVQKDYWVWFRKIGWSKYGIPSTIAGIDAIIEHVLVDKPDFDNLDALTQQLEQKTLNFINDIIDVLITLDTLSQRQ